MDSKLLMIPGPIEFNQSVNAAVGMQALSHVSPQFIDEFGESLELMRKVWQAPTGQPFIIAGSGTLAMDSAVVNLVEPGDRVLVLSTGYFGERYAALLERYGAVVDIIRSQVGETIDPVSVEEKLKVNRYRLMTITHVDTSTAVRVNPVPFGALGRKYGVLTILDGVCSVAGEEAKQEEWGIDLLFTASQKAIGVPPGLALLVASAAAMKRWRTRKSKVGNYYADWGNWLPVMQAYEERRGSYFGTPAVNLVRGLNRSLKQILEEGLDARFARHERQARAFRAAMNALNLGQLPVSEDLASNTLSAPLIPTGVKAPELLKAIAANGVVVAGGLLPEMREHYFRVGHMGTATASAHILKTIKAIETALASCGCKVKPGSGSEAASKLLK